jgi:predicted aspartyl protease
VKRTAIIIAWLASVLLAYLAGRSDVRPSGATDPIAVGGAVAPVALVPSVNPAAEAEERSVLDAVAEAEALVRDGRPHDALVVLASYLEGGHIEADERYSRALFLLSDLRQMTGEAELALVPLFEILRYPPSQATAERARKRLNLLINAREQQLINADDLVGLVNYFEYLVSEDPGFDGHRLKLARWLLKSGEVETAARIISETGLVGVEQAEIDLLLEEIELASTALPVERQAGAMYTAATVRGRSQGGEFRFLIDTGATMSGLAESSLQAVGANLVERGIRVHTANGVVELPVYRLRELKVGALVLNDLAVLGFADLPRGADGILGMDVLSKLGGSLAGAVGRPQKAR